MHAMELDTSSFLTHNVERLIRDNVKDAVIWDEKSLALKGKYFYLSIRNVQVGIFLGFTINDRRVDRCIVFCFSDPKGRVDKRVAELLEHIFSNLSSILSDKGFTLIRDDLPALVRKSGSIDSMNESSILEFFKESLCILLNTLNNLRGSC